MQKALCGLRNWLINFHVFFFIYFFYQILLKLNRIWKTKQSLWLFFIAKCDLEARCFFSEYSHSIIEGINAPLETQRTSAWWEPLLIDKLSGKCHKNERSLQNRNIEKSNSCKPPTPKGIHPDWNSNPNPNPNSDSNSQLQRSLRLFYGLRGHVKRFTASGVWWPDLCVIYFFSSRC